MAGNPDWRLVSETLRSGAATVPVRTNPVFEDLGATLVSAAPGQVSLAFHLHERATQGDGLVHGGVVSTMLDGSMAFAVLTQLGEGESTATVSLTVNFHSAARDRTFTVTAEVDKSGRRIAFTRARATSGGRTVATATAVFAVLRAEND